MASSTWVAYTFVFLLPVLCGAKYLPEWKSLDSRPLPPWYDDAKFGIFIHWGVYSVPSYVSEWFWWYWKGDQPKHAVVEFMKNNYDPSFTYADFASTFKAELYDPTEWVDILKASGARYVVATSKHHEGFTMYPSSYSWNWNSADVGPRRDIVGDLATEIRNKSKLHFGLYYSLFEWFHPLYRHDKENNFSTTNYVKTVSLPQLQEIVTQYKPEVLWADGAAGPDVYWKSKEFLAWLYNDSPVKDVVVSNDRWGSHTLCKHGGFYTCADRYQPGHLVNHKWENCMTIDKKSWGFRREAKISDFLTTYQLIANLIETVSYGGNFLLNIAPTHYGKISPIFEERLRDIGKWLNINGEAVYGSKPWTYQNDSATPGVWYTEKENVVYATFLHWPSQNLLHLGSISTGDVKRINMLGYEPPLPFRNASPTGINVDVSNITLHTAPTIWAWTLKIV